MKVDHYFTTRFNVRLSEGSTEKKNIGRHIDPAWLAGRFDIFERF